MGLRLASLRHTNVVMAPALTETVQSQSFKFATSPSRSPSLSLKKHHKKEEIICEELEPKLTNGLRYSAGMNGHSPTNNKTTYSINGLAKSLKNEFLPLNKKKEVTKDDVGSRSDSNYSITQIGGYMMNSGFMGDSEMGLRKSNKDLNEGEKVSPEVDQLIKNLSVVMNSEEMGTNPELNQNVEEIFKAITNLDNNTSNELVSGPSGETEPIFADMGALSNFERDLFNDVDVMNMCVDESLVTVNKDTLIKEKIEEFRKRKFLLWRRIEFLVRRLKKAKAHILGRHASEEITGVIEYTSNLLEASSRLKVYSSDASDVNVQCDVKPVSLSGLSLFMRQMDHAVNQQTNTVARNSIRQCKYFGSGSSSNSLVSTSNGVRSSLPGSILPSFSSEAKKDLTTTYGELHSQLVKLQQDFDSDVTESSSGCESCDEFINYNNVHQHPLSISKRASWKWAEERALIAAKWTWLQSQIADLEYRIRQHSDIRRQVRSSKGSVKLQEESSLPSNNLPNGCNSEKGEGSCCRTRGLIPGLFGKRRIWHINGLHRTSKKAARSCGLRCSCNTNLPGCGLCTGRSEPGQPLDPLSTLPVSQRVAYLDPGFHPVLSFPQDVSASVHYDAVMKCSDWQSRASRIQGKASLTGEEKSRVRPVTNNDQHVVDLQRSKAAALAVSVKLRRKIARGRRRRRNPSLNLENYRQKRKHSTGLSSIDSEEGIEPDADVSSNSGTRFTSLASSPTPAQHTTSISKDKETVKRKRENSYDIDNIVIPYSMASATRLEKLNYKEILTPKWRRIMKSERHDSLDQKNGIIRRSSHEAEGEEDISEEAAIARHERCEVDEKKKFLSYLKLPNSSLHRGRGQRRTDSRADSSGPNTPDGMSPRDDGPVTAEDSLASPPPTPSDIETNKKKTISSQQLQLPEVSPYEPRVFPLNDETYRKMIEESKESQHYPVTNSSFEESIPPMKSPGSVSTDSAESFLGEDPNDPEWTTVDRSNTKR